MLNLQSKRYPNLLPTMLLGLSLGLLGSAAPSATAAEYRGQRLDGRSFEATVIALHNNNQAAAATPQEAKVNFSGYQAILYFNDGSYTIVELEDIKIRDRNNIKAVDLRNRIQWKLDLE
jgi:hypothetical protein